MPSKDITIRPNEETDRIVSFIRQIIRGAPANGVVVALSGGIDSAIVGALCVRALGKSNVLGLMLPSEHSPREDTEDASTLAESWGIRAENVPISGIVKTLIDSVKIEGKKVARANVEARVRMLILYYYANTLGYLVAGTGDRSESLLGYFCYDQQTKVVTPDGPKSWNELRRGDTVYSYNLRTGEVVESKAAGVHIFGYEGVMIHFRAAGADLMVTPNHRMLIRTTSDPSICRITYRSASECLAFKKTVVPVPSFWRGKPGMPERVEIQFEQRQIKRIVRIDIDDALYSIGLFVGDGLAVKGKATIPVLSGLSSKEHASLPRDSQGRFVLLTREIRVPRLKTYDTYETDFALPVTDKNEARTKLVKILEKYGIGYSVTQNLVRIPGKGIYDFFFQFGVGAHNKHIPAWVLSYSSEHLANLLRGLKDSDGAHAVDQHVYYTSSPGLKDDFCELAVKLGRYPTTRERPPRVSFYKGKEIRTGPSYEISYGKGGHFSRVLERKKARKVDYQGKVWCPSVPPHENVLVERNGRYIFSGNTKYGDGGTDFLPIAHLYKTQVRALGAHLGLPRRIVEKPASPQLWPGQKASDEIPADYDKLDVVLHSLFDLKTEPSEAASRAGVPISVVEKVLEMHRRTAHKRLLPPSLA